MALAMGSNNMANDDVMDIDIDMDFGEADAIIDAGLQLEVRCLTDH
jgi:hypothetical protein